jgi:hypothetical protein
MLVVFARSTVAGAFAISRALNIRVESSAMLVLDAPAQGSTTGQTFVVGGWAIDAGAASGGGVDLVHVYAYPLDTGGAPLFLGQTTASQSRPDVGAAFGARYSRAGFHMDSGAVPPGRYRVVAYGRSEVTWTFSVAAIADITVR